MVAFTGPQIFFLFYNLGCWVGGPKFVACTVNNHEKHTLIHVHIHTHTHTHTLALSLSLSLSFSLYYPNRFNFNFSVYLYVCLYRPPSLNLNLSLQNFLFLSLFYTKQISSQSFYSRRKIQSILIIKLLNN